MSNDQQLCVLNNSNIEKQSNVTEQKKNIDFTTRYRSHVFKLHQNFSISTNNIHLLITHMI